ncbi:MAG: hypothetical protein R3C03_01275 [Pirellulaceae bacterium]
MSRFNHLLARLVILALIVLCLWIGSKPVVDRMVVSKIQALTGGHAEIANIESDLSRGQVRLHGVSLVNPKSPMENLLQADLIEFELDADALWYKKFVVTDGVIRNLKLATPRSTSGELDKVASATNALSVVEACDPVFEPGDVDAETAQRWVDQFSPHVLGQTQSVPEIATKFSVASAALETRSQQIREHIQQIVHSIAKSKESLGDSRFENPLRDERLNSTRVELETATKQLTAALREIELFQANGADQIANLVSVTQSQLESMNEIKTPFQIDSGLANGVLLEGIERSYSEKILNWLAWFRNATPISKDLLRPQNSFGAHIQFRGETPQADLLFRKLNIEGSGQFDGEHIEYAGTIENLSTHPELIDEPMKIFFRAQGREHFVVEATVRHADGKCIEEYHVLCPDWKSPGRVIGDSDVLLANLGGSDLNAEATITMIDGELDGKIVVKHRNTALILEELHQLAGGAVVRDLVNQRLAAINAFDVSISLGGTLRHPELKSESDLGNLFNQAMLEAFARKSQIQIAEKKELLKKQFDESNSALKSKLNSLVQELYSNLNEPRETLAELQTTLEKQESTFR